MGAGGARMETRGMMAAKRVPASPAGRAGIAELRSRLADRPRDETLSVEDRRRAIEAFTAPASRSIAVEHVDLGVPVELHVPSHAAAGALVYAHGGAYVIGSAATHRALAAAIAGAAGLRLYAVDYRLAPEHPFPAGRDDVVATFEAVSAREAAPVALVGDSAGGGIVLQAALVLRDRAGPQPCAIAVTSPWIDLGLSGATYEANRSREAMLTPEGLRLDAGRYLGGAPADAANVSVLYSSLVGLPPVLIQAGEDEILLDDSIALAERLRSAGVSADLEIWEGMIHSWHAFRGLVPEAERAIGGLGGFLRRAVDTIRMKESA